MTSDLQTSGLQGSVDDGPSSRGPSLTAPVVVGFDEHAAAGAAVRWAAAQAARLGSDLVVLSACEPPVLGPAGGGAIRSAGGGAARAVPDPWTVSRAVAGRGAELARQGDPDGAIQAVGAVGGAAAELVARSSDAALVVVGRNHRSALQAAVLGSVSFAVAMHARCPVVVVGEDATPAPGPAAPVVVGVDGSRPSRGAVVLAAELAEAWQAPLLVVSTWQAPATTLWPDLPADPLSMAASAEAWESAARAAVDEAVSQAVTAHPGLAVTGTVLEGRADDVLVDLSRSAGLLVVGSRGHGGFAGLMMGSVSHAVMRRGHSPVAVVRRGSV